MFVKQQDEEKAGTLKRIAQLETIIVEINAELSTANEKLESASKFATNVIHNNASINQVKQIF